MQLCVEKGLDAKSEAAIAQCDIKQFYDFLSPIRLAHWIIEKGGSPALANAVVKLHCVPTIVIAAKGTSCTIGLRSRGVLTGTRSANTLGRVPMIDFADKHPQEIIANGFKTDSSIAGLSSFVDNLLAIGHSIHSVTSILDTCCAFLARQWALTVEDSTKEVRLALHIPTRSMERPLGQR